MSNFANGGWILVGILGLALLMVVHEAGHFFVARAFGMRVTRFSIGFGPTFFKIVPRDGFFWFTTAADKIRLRLWRHNPEKHGPTIYQVAMIPFLAYVQIAGMNPLEDIEPDDKGSYANASLFGRIATIVGGPLANYLFASVLFFFAFLFGGRPVEIDTSKPLPTDIAVVEEQGKPPRPAAAAGMKTGDKVVEISGVAVTDWKKMAEVISKHPNEALPIVVEREGARVTLTVTPAPDAKGDGKIGVAMMERREPVSTGQAAILALKTPPRVVKMLVTSMGELIAGRIEGRLTGPVGIVEQAASEARGGMTYLFSFLGGLSAYLGAFNLVPFPALDGGRLMFLGYEATTRRRPNARIEQSIHLVGMVMMLGLMFYVTIANDLHFGAK
jgi:regulator of sigma E protease